MPSAVAIHSIERVALRLHRKLPELVWDASMLEGNFSTYPEVKTFLDGVTGGGRTAFDQEQVLNLARSSKRLLTLVKAGKFFLSKGTFTDNRSRPCVLSLLRRSFC